ncbi:MAG TPA: GrpB family protein [Pseudonocardiaceae bacterium]|nr:GrpB family protein [Pseudonocardiaceae bacterium]
MPTIVDYDPTWPHRFAEQSDAVLKLAGDHILVIEHFGSTAVPGLAAKPVIDMVVAVRSVDEDGPVITHAVAPLGYVPFDAGMPGRLMLTRDENGVRTEHLHIVPEERWDLLKERLLRDWLLAHPVDRDRYGALKRELTELEGLDYTRAKTALIQEIVDAARAERGLPSESVWEE